MYFMGESGRLSGALYNYFRPQPNPAILSLTASRIVKHWSLLVFSLILVYVVFVLEGTNKRFTNALNALGGALGNS